MNLMMKFICAILTRLSFIMLSLVAVWRVTYVKANNHFWFLSFLCLPLFVEMIITLRDLIKKREQEDYKKWFSPVILLFLIAIIPSIWILELNHRKNKKAYRQCEKLDSLEILGNITTGNILKSARKLHVSVCPDDWILGLQQALVILMIVGKWALPQEGGITRDKLSQLLLIFVGTAADIVEFNSETLSDIEEKNPLLVSIILAVWTWSMLQFPLHLAVVTVDESSKAAVLCGRITDKWSIMESLFIMDGPFLLVRLVVIFQYEIVHQMLVFFIIKNFLMVILNLYWLIVICLDSRDSRGHNYSIP